MCRRWANASANVKRLPTVNWIRVPVWWQCRSQRCHRHRRRLRCLWIQTHHHFLPTHNRCMPCRHMLKRRATDFTNSINATKSATHIDLCHEMRTICPPTTAAAAAASSRMRRISSKVIRRRRQRQPTHSAKSNQNYRSQLNQSLELSKCVFISPRKLLLLLLYIVYCVGCRTQLFSVGRVYHISGNV